MEIKVLEKNKFSKHLVSPHVVSLPAVLFALPHAVGESLALLPTGSFRLSATNATRTTMAPPALCVAMPLDHKFFTLLMKLLWEG